MRSDLEKQASILAKVWARTRHPLKGSLAKRKALEERGRAWAFNNVNEGIKKKLQKWKLDKGSEHITRFTFFPKKQDIPKGLKGWLSPKVQKGADTVMDPIREIAPSKAGEKTIELLADNPEALPLLLPYAPSGALIGYLVSKAAVYKGLGIPTPAHIRHIRQKKKIYDAVKSTSIGIGLAGGGVIGHQKLKSFQKKRKEYKTKEQVRERRRELRRRRSIYLPTSRGVKRAEMYKSAASEIQKIAAVRRP